MHSYARVFVLTFINVVQGKHPQIHSGIGMGYRQVAVESTKPVISLKWGKILEQKLLPTYMGYRWLPKRVNLNDLYVRFKVFSTFVLLIDRIQHHISVPAMYYNIV